MQVPIFEFPSFQYDVDDWDFKKKGLMNRINKSKFIRTRLATYEGDRQTNGKTYVRYLEEFLRPELSQFCLEAQVSCSMSDAWCVRYKKGDHQAVHNHRGWGFTGVLYVEYDPEFHTPTAYVQPWQNPRNDTTTFAYPDKVKEGTLVITPSFTFHYANPNNSNKRRTVLSFDLLPSIPDHQAINIDGINN